MKGQEEKYIDKFIKQLGQGLVEDIQDSVPKILKDIVDIRFRGLKDGLEPLKDINAKLIDQAGDIENLQISYKHLTEEFEAFRRSNQNIPQKTMEAAKEGAAKGAERKMNEKTNEFIQTVRTELENTPTKPARPTRRKLRQKFPFNLFGGGR